MTAVTPNSRPSTPNSLSPLFNFLGGLGWGLDNDVLQAYEFITKNYEPGDEISFFGFSRGAFTVRAVAGLLCDVGVLSAVHMPRFPALWEAYRQNTSGEPFRSSTWYRNYAKELRLIDVRVKIIGVWDTVGALASTFDNRCSIKPSSSLTWI